jgi:hypothetical protein
MRFQHTPGPLNELVQRALAARALDGLKTVASRARERSCGLMPAHEYYLR